MGETNSPILLLFLHPRIATTALFLTDAQLPKGGNWKVAILVRAGERKRVRQKSKRLSPGFHARQSEQGRGSARWVKVYGRAWFAIIL